MSTVFRTLHGDQPIDPTELISPARALKIAQELSAANGEQQYTVQEWVCNIPDCEVIYDGPERIMQIMPGFQNAAQLRNAQDANPKGHWDMYNPLAVEWVADLNRVVDTSGGAANVDLSALAAGPAVAYNKAVLDLLTRIAKAVGA